MRASLEVEAERDGVAGQPMRILVQHRLRQRIGERDQNAREDHGGDDDTPQFAVESSCVDHLHLHAIGDFDRDFGIFLGGRLGDLADDATRGHNGIAAAYVVDRQQ